MNSIQKRFLLFIFGCILTRSLFVIIAKRIDNKYLPYLGYLALIPAIAWIYIYFFNNRDIGPEVFGGKIWWNELRLIHALLYILFAIYAIQKKTFSYIPLLIDVIIGFVGFINYHISENNLSKLF